MSAVTIPLETYAADIRALHNEAHDLAGQAIERAIECGRLLTEAKAALPHGEFGTWLADNCGFSDRTARRYMTLHTNRASLPKGYGIKAALDHLRPAKTDTVSVSWLPADDAVEFIDALGVAYFVWRSGDYAHAVRVDEGATAVDATRKPIRVDHVGKLLAYLGLSGPESRKWKQIPRERGEWLRGLAFSGDAQ